MNKQVGLIILVFIVSFAVIFGGLYYILLRPHGELKSGKLTLGNNSLNVQIADTFASRAQGLSGRDKLAPNEGMLFLFPIKAPYGFWMNDMKFPLDMVWISDSKVIGISKDVPAPTSATNIATATPPAAINMALEINAGEADKLKINIGDQATLEN